MVSGRHKIFVIFEAALWFPGQKDRCTQVFAKAANIFAPSAENVGKNIVLGVIFPDRGRKTLWMSTF
jgi:hypothetical protein